MVGVREGLGQKAKRRASVTLGTCTHLDKEDLGSVLPWSERTNMSETGPRSLSRDDRGRVVMNYIR